MSEEEPNAHALDLVRKLRALPEVAQCAELSIQTSTRIRPQGLIITLKRYHDRCIDSLKDNIQNIIDAIEYMGPGSKNRLYSFAFNDGSSKIQFIAIAMQKDKTEDLVDYCIGTYSYQAPKQITYDYVWNSSFWGFRKWQEKVTTESNVEITGETRVLLEASFLYELCRRGAASIDNNSSFKLAIEQ